MSLQKEESYLLAGEKGPQERGQVVVFVIHLYILHFLIRHRNIIMIALFIRHEANKRQTDEQIFFLDKQMCNYIYLLLVFVMF